MRRGLFVALLFGLFFTTLPLLGAVPEAQCASVETRCLVASDATGQMSDAELKDQAEQAQATLERVLEFWSVDAGIAQFGKIRIIFDQPRRENYSCVFYWERGPLGRVRAIRVFGHQGGTQMLAHKLTSAIFPQPDKLIRNAMGILAETHVGSPRTFPRCGFSADDWVLALLRMDAFLPLKDLGPDHESWGMADGGNGRLMVLDRGRQHRAYAEAGSFGLYLYTRYGLDKIKEFHRLSGQGARPAQEVFGLGVDELERNWLAVLRQSEKSNDANIAAVLRLFQGNPRTACVMAQRVSAGTR